MAEDSEFYTPATRSPTFHSMLQATGNGEAWHDSTEAYKFQQYGWRSGKQDDLYSTGVLIGNWNEERFDVKYRAKRIPLPSQFEHYYETTYQNDLAGPRQMNVEPEVKNLKEKLPRAFPHHQPELDAPKMKYEANDWRTEFRRSYIKHCP